jgi:tripartite-type tricarboxylate transporter receptor subunit TctC
MLIVFFIALLTLPLKVDAQQPHFHGKTITLQVGAPAGGRQDRIARTLTKYLTKYTPGNPVFLI